MRARRLGVALAAGLLAAITGGALAFAGLGGEDAVKPCPVMVVLNGDHPARADEAARRYRAGFGSEIWLTDDPRSGDGHVDTGTRSNVTHLVRGGVPRSAISIVPGAAIGTRAELAAIAAEMRRRELPCVIAVTSPLHGARVKVTWWSLVGSRPRVIVVHAPNAHYAGWEVALRELGLTMLAAAGLR
jgi:uncharacterized SAM-binding protein YcdF (DUF218 family)